MKILIVEDNKKLLQTIEKELKKHFEVECCEDGEEAFYLIKQGIYDLVVLDLMLPSMNGIEVLKNIRKNYIDTPVLILTAKESLDEKMEAFSMGANDYLTKPFYMEELVARIYAMLRTTGKLQSSNTLDFYDLHLDSVTLPRPVKILATFHPAALLRNPGWKKDAWLDLQMVMAELGLKGAAK